MGRLLTRACQNERAWNGSFTLGPLHNNNNGPKENKKKKKRKNYAIAIELIPLPRWRLVTFTDESRWRWGRWASRLSGSIDVSAKEMARRGRAQSESLSSLAHTHISFVCVCVCAGLHHLLLPCCSSSRYTLPRLHIFPVSRHFFFSRFWHATKQTKPTTQKNPKEKKRKETHQQQIHMCCKAFSS